MDVLWVDPPGWCILPAMDVNYWVRGIVIGFSIAAPVGPIGLLCIRRSLNQGMLTGLLTGLGAATADACYGCLAGFGLTVITRLLIEQNFWLQLIGGVFLCCLGLKTFQKHETETASAHEVRGHLMAYGSAFLLTITNPMTIVSFTAIFAGIGIVTAPNGYAASITLVTGVFMGSSLWWAVLTGSLKIIRRKLTPATHQWLNRLSGIILLLFGIWSLADSLI